MEPKRPFVPVNPLSEEDRRASRKGQLGRFPSLELYEPEEKETPAQSPKAETNKEIAE